MKEEQFKPLEEEIIVKQPIINLPEAKKKEEKKEQSTIIKLPTWSIEPPIEIKRGK